MLKILLPFSSHTLNYVRIGAKIKLNCEGNFLSVKTESKKLVSYNILVTKKEMQKYLPSKVI